MSSKIHSDKDSENFLQFFYHNHSYCDWRVTISCEDSRIDELSYMINFILVSLVAIACIILLWYRIGRQGHTVFSPKAPGTGLIRPNPVEGFLVWVIPWLIGRILFIIILWTERFKDNYLILESLQMYWTCGATGYTWFVIGTYLQIGNHLNSKRRPWRPNSKLSDMCLILMTIILPMTMWPIIIASGYFRNKNNVKLADILISIRYMLWAIWYGFGALITYHFRRELCNMLKYRISEDNNITAGRVKRMKFGLKKISLIFHIILSVYIFFLIYCPFTSIFRVWIMNHFKLLNIFMLVTQSFINPFCILFVLGKISLRIILCKLPISNSKSELMQDKKIDTSQEKTNINNVMCNLPISNSKSELIQDKKSDTIQEKTNITNIMCQHTQFNQFNQFNNTNNNSEFINIKIRIVDTETETGSGSDSESNRESNRERRDNWYF